jgi:HAD superfamily hydrolase (TIGR01490 family)
MALTEKRIAFFDVDNTLLKGSTLFFLGRGMYQRGFFTKKDISAFVMANIRYRLTGKENKEEITRFQNAATDFIKGHNVIEIEKIGQEIYEEYVSPAIWQGTVEIAKEHLSKDEEVWLVTATPLDMANLMAKRLGLTGALGTKAEVENGVYTGKIIGNLLHGREKATAIKDLAINRGIDLNNCYAYSDSHHDIPLLEAVGNPRVINPDALLKIRAYRDGWPIYDFRRARRIRKLLGPVAGRMAAIASLISPRKQKPKG